jgi:hypothetical protein
MYDPLLDTWTKRADIPSARCYHATCAFNGKIYVFGGGPGVWSSADRAVFVFDPQTGVWTRKPDMPYAIGACGIAVVENVIYLIGGAATASSPAVKTVMAYDPITGSWTPKADMPTARLCLSACAVDGKIYAMGGYNGDWNVSAYKTVEVYDPFTNSWTRKRDMPTGRWSPAACVVDGKIYATGGNLAMQALTANEVYDPATDTWTTKSPMQRGRLGHFVGSIEGKIYAIAGHYPWLIMVSKTEEYDVGLTAPSPDLNEDGVVDCADLCVIVDHWLTSEPSCDLAPPPFGDGVVDRKDLEVLMSYWGQEIPHPALIAHWKLDEAEGTIAEDRAGDNYSILHGGPVWLPASGKKGGALQLDGVDDYVSTPFVSNPVDGAFSAFAWVKGGAPGQVVISQIDGAGSGETWLGTEPVSGEFVSGLVPPPTGRTAMPGLKSESVITDDHWHHIGFVWDGSYRALYVDGTEVVKDSAVQNPLKSADGGLFIGAGKNLDAETFFSGLIDDVCIYNVALTADEINTLMH